MTCELELSSESARIVQSAEIGESALLAIDTALGTSVALGVAGNIYEAVSDDPLRHAEAIGGLLARVFADSGVSPKAVTGVVVGVGPGPFTGLRVGIAAAQAFAKGRGVPLLPLHGHEAVALSVLELGASHGVRVVQDARRRELFVTEYSSLDWAGVPMRTVDAHLVTRADFVATPEDVWPARIPASRLIQLAARKLMIGADFEEMRALYLRDPDVRPPSTPKRVVA